MILINMSPLYIHIHIYIYIYIAPQPSHRHISGVISDKGGTTRQIVPYFCFSPHMGLLNQGESKIWKIFLDTMLWPARQAKKDRAGLCIWRPTNNDKERPGRAGLCILRPANKDQERPGRPGLCKFGVSTIREYFRFQPLIQRAAEQ